jgi:hypothetical protein
MAVRLFLLAIYLLKLFRLFVPFEANHAGNVDHYSGAMGLAVGGGNHNMMPPPANQQVQVQVQGLCVVSCQLQDFMTDFLERRQQNSRTAFTTPSVRRNPRQRMGWEYPHTLYMHEPR